LSVSCPLGIDLLCSSIGIAFEYDFVPTLCPVEKDEEYACEGKLAQAMLRVSNESSWNAIGRNSLV
jgi:hypothetical protein